MAGMAVVHMDAGMIFAGMTAGDDLGIDMPTPGILDYVLELKAAWER